MKDEYIFYLSSIWPKVRHGGLVIADNIMAHKGVIGIEAYKFTVNMTGMHPSYRVTDRIGRLVLVAGEREVKNEKTLTCCFGEHNMIY